MCNDELPAVSYVQYSIGLVVLSGRERMSAVVVIHPLLHHPRTCFQWDDDGDHSPEYTHMVAASNGCCATHWSELKSTNQEGEARKVKLTRFVANWPLWKGATRCNQQFQTFINYNVKLFIEVSWFSALLQCVFWWTCSHGRGSVITIRYIRLCLTYA